jgi:hypothetical protein
MTQPILAWHFTAATLRDGRPIPPDGVTLKHTGPLVMCQSGLHASVRIIDALEYAPGATICRVECGGETIHGMDKLVCSKRTILWRVDGTNLLRQFARLCALDVIHQWDALPIVREYLETGDEDIRDAARDARDVSWAVAQDAWAVWDAAQASWAAALTAARAAQNSRLEALIITAHEAQK